MTYRYLIAFQVSKENRADLFALMRRVKAEESHTNVVRLTTVKTPEKISGEIGELLGPGDLACIVVESTPQCPALFVRGQDDPAVPPGSMVLSGTPRHGTVARFEPTSPAIQQTLDMFGRMDPEVLAKAGRSAFQAATKICEGLRRWEAGELLDPQLKQRLLEEVPDRIKIGEPQT